MANRDSKILITMHRLVHSRAPWLIGRAAQRILQWFFFGVGAIAAGGVVVNAAFVVYRLASHRPLSYGPHDDLVPDTFANALIAACCLATARDLRSGAMLGTLTAFIVFLVMTVQATRFGPPGFGFIGTPFLLLTLLALLQTLAPLPRRVPD